MLLNNIYCITGGEGRKGYILDIPAVRGLRAVLRGEGERDREGEGERERKVGEDAYLT